MAPNEGAEAVTSADTGATNDEDGPAVVDHVDNGVTPVVPRRAGTNGDRALPAEHEDEELTGPLPAPRSGRKRTARQRALLVQADDEPNGAAPVDPLIGDAAGDPADTLDRRGQTDVVGDDGADEKPPWSDDPVPTGRLDTNGYGTEADWLEPAPAILAGTAVVDLTTTVPPPPAPETELVPTPPPPAAVPPPPRPARRRARPRVRKVTRVVRSVDAWSVFKVALIFFVAMGVVLLTASVLLWNLAQSTGTLDNVEGFFKEAFNYDSFKLQADPLFHAALVVTVLFVIAGTGTAVVMAVLFNLIADLTGGIRVTVLEREVVARDDPRKRARRRAGRNKRLDPPAGASPPAAPPVIG